MRPNGQPVSPKPAASSSLPPRKAPHPWIDPQTLMAIRHLELRAKIVVEGFWKGLHRSPYHGFSVEFSEYRQYSPGDDTRYLDWRLYARSDRFYLKKFEDETNLRCQLLVDQSRSMHFGSSPVTKAQYANTLAATLAYFLFTQGDAVGLLTFDDRVREYLPARNRTGHLRHLMLALEKQEAGPSTNLLLPLEHIAQLLKKRGLVILLSDFLAPLDHFEKKLAALSACGHELLLFQILDPAEITFSFDKPVLFEDLETEQKLYIDPALARHEYVSKLDQHLATIHRAAAKLGIPFHRFATNQPLELALFDLLRRRMQSSKFSRSRHLPARTPLKTP